ncbi:helix-turn-helix domain-containing protein (plasmid) [Streptomyces sp. NBC_01795]|nr:helix-turn-helix transcriptional regulator [Streptomyces sp. NBC_01795]WSA97558.1 helix-turn-helix domain-containing protein [Streptomyces sp. NBC_01795]
MSTSTLPDLGAVIRGARAAARMTQTQLGRCCGYSHSAISRIETGHTVPDWPTVARLAAVLGIGPEKLGLAHSSGSPPTGAAPVARATRVPSRPDAEDWEDAVRRRQMLALTGTAATAVLAGLPAAATARPQPAADPDLSGLEDALLYGPPPSSHEATTATVALAVSESRALLAQGRYRELAAGLPHQLALAETYRDEDGGSALSSLLSTAARAAIKAGDDRDTDRRPRRPHRPRGR